MRAMAGESVPGMDGYHWNLANWGVKWDIYVDKIDRETLGWTEGEEPGCYFAGDMLGENGVVSTEYYNDEKLREIFAWTEA